MKGMVIRSNTTSGPERTPSRTQKILIESLILFALLVGMLGVAWLHGGSWERPERWLFGLVVTAWVPLLIRKRHPLAALLGATAMECLHVAILPLGPHHFADPGALGAYQPVPLATAFAAWTLATSRFGYHGWLPGVAAAVTLFITGLIAQPLELLTSAFLMLNVVVLASVLGAIPSSRRERIRRQEQTREEHTHRAVVDERMRIARELHDALAHRLTLVNAQATTAEYLLDQDKPGVEAAVKGIAGHTRQALNELRTTVEVLRENGTNTATAEARAPTQGINDLDDLISEFRASGARIAVHLEGQPRVLSTSGDLAAYRIVQESLTNAFKHAPGADVRVYLTWRPDELDIEILNGLRRDGRHSPSGSRSGLIGMRERALAAGGQFASARLDDGGFGIHARIPTASHTGSSKR